MESDLKNDWRDLFLFVYRSLCPVLFLVAIVLTGVIGGNWFFKALAALFVAMFSFDIFIVERRMKERNFAMASVYYVAMFILAVVAACCLDR